MIKKFLPFLVVFGIGLWSVRAMISCPTCVADFGKDGYLINWMINSAGKNLYGLHSGTGGGLFDGNIFYPYRNVLAYSDMYFVTGFWTFPWALLAQNWGIVSGLALVSGQLLTMTMIYVWWNKLSGNRWAAVVGTVAFGLSQIRFHYQVHLQVWSMQYMLLGLWWIFGWINEKKNWKLYAGAAVLALQVWESLLPVFFAGAVLAVWGVMYWRQIKGQMKNILLAGAVAVVIAAPVLWTYLRVGREFNYQRSVREAAHNGMSVDELTGRFASPGLYLLSGWAGIYLWRRRKESGWDQNPVWLGIIAAASLIMALGPVLKWEGSTVKLGRIFVPLPYAAAYYLVPGFGALRTPSRWIWMAGWAVSGLVAIALGKALEKKKNKAVAVVMLLGLATLGGTGILKTVSLPTGNQVSEAYKWVEKQPGRVVAILPMVNDDSQTEPMVYFLDSDKLLVNGYSGFYPPGRAMLSQRLNSSFANDATWAELKQLGVNWVIVNKEKIQISGGRNWIPHVRYEDGEFTVIAVE